MHYVYRLLLYTHTHTRTHKHTHKHTHTHTHIHTHYYLLFIVLIWFAVQCLKPFEQGARVETLTALRHCSGSAHAVVHQVYTNSTCCLRIVYIKFMGNLQSFMNAFGIIKILKVVLSTSSKIYFSRVLIRIKDMSTFSCTL